MPRPLSSPAARVRGNEFPRFGRPEGKAWVWKELRREGDVVARILNSAKSADLIVMATEGTQGIVDACVEGSAWFETSRAREVEYTGMGRVSDPMRFK